MILHVEPHHLARVMFRGQILHRQAVCRVQTPEFQSYVQVMFRPIIRTEKKYVERQFTIFITLCETFFNAFYFTDMRYDTIFISWIKCFVSVCQSYRLSLPFIRFDRDSCRVMKFISLRTTCSVAIQNKGLKLEFNLLKQLLFILLCLYLICAEYISKTFGSTSDQTRLMALYPHTDVIVVILKQYIH